MIGVSRMTHSLREFAIIVASEVDVLIFKGSLQEPLQEAEVVFRGVERSGASPIITTWSWQLTVGKWLLAIGSWQLAKGSWQFATGNLQLAAANWQMTTGKWQLGAAVWQLAICS